MKVINLVKAGSIVFTVCIDAFINIMLTGCSIKSRWAETLIASNTVNTASFILTRIGRAVVDIHFAIGSLKTCDKERTVIQWTL